MIEEPLVSIITINYNCYNYIQKHLNSVSSLNYSNWEHIFVDCGSTDGSIEIVNQNLHPKLVFHKIGFCTVSEARNYAIKNSNGLICSILDSDDLMCEDRLTNQINLLTKSPDNVIVGGGFVGIMNRSNIIARFLLRNTIKVKMPVEKVDINILINSAFLPFPHSTFTFYKKDFYLVGGYKIDKSEDYELVLALNKLGNVVSVDNYVSVINFGRINSHSTHYKPNNRTPLHFAFFSLIKDSIKEKKLIISDIDIHKELDKFTNIQLLILQTKWLFLELFRSKRLFKKGNFQFALNLAIRNLNSIYKIKFFLSCPVSKDKFIYKCF